MSMGSENSLLIFLWSLAGVSSIWESVRPCGKSMFEHVMSTSELVTGDLSRIRGRHNPPIRFKKNLFKTNFGYVLTNLGVFNRFQPTIYTVVDEESESEVQNIQNLQENPKQTISKL